MLIKIILPNSKKSSNRLVGFFNALFFWVTIIVTFKEWLKYKTLAEANTAVIVVNGRRIRASKVEIIDGHIYADGMYICPSEIECLTCKDSSKN